MIEDQIEKAIISEAKLLEKIEIILSEKRLQAYHASAEGTTIDALAYKAWNMALCGSLYPIFQLVEVCLRNSIHNAISQHLMDDNWFKNKQFVEEQGLKIVHYTIKNFEQLQRSSDCNYIISELHFGFWIGLLSKRYERKIWHPLLEQIFSYVPKHQKTRKFICQKFREIKKLRNRVFHHQRIWHLSDLVYQRNAIIEAIGWIEPVIVRFIKRIDTFDKVYSEGFKYYKGKIAEALDSER